eukprot:5067734-Amphidinium_carterae.1
MTTVVKVRYTATKFVAGQIRNGCDNLYNEIAVEELTAGQISVKTLWDLISRAFNASFRGIVMKVLQGNASELVLNKPSQVLQDNGLRHVSEPCAHVGALFKRAIVFVNTNKHFVAKIHGQEFAKVIDLPSDGSTYLKAQDGSGNNLGCILHTWD